MRNHNPNGFLILMIAIVAASLLTGCDEDKRLAEQANENARRQAEQNIEMARVNHEVAEGSKRLVEGSAAANEKLLAAQQSLDRQRAQIDAEHQTLAAERNRESILGPLITSIGALAVCALPLILCWFLLNGLRKGSGQEADLSQLLVEEIVAERPILLPPPRAKSNDRHGGPALESESPLMKLMNEQPWPSKE